MMLWWRSENWEKREMNMRDIADRVIVKQALTYCEKPLVFCRKDVNSQRDIYEMALLIRGGKENFV